MITVERQQPRFLLKSVQAAVVGGKLSGKDSDCDITAERLINTRPWTGTAKTVALG